MVGSVDEAAAELISGINKRVGLQSLLQVPTIREMYGRIGGADFYNSAIGVLKGLIEVANGRGITPIAAEHSARLAYAQSMLEMELARTPIQNTPSDAEPRMVHRDGVSLAMVGGGPQEGGYAIELNPEGENRIVTR